MQFQDEDGLADVVMYTIRVRIDSVDRGTQVHGKGRADIERWFYTLAGAQVALAAVIAELDRLHPVRALDRGSVPLAPPARGDTYRRGGDTYRQGHITKDHITTMTPTEHIVVWEIRKWQFPKHPGAAGSRRYHLGVWTDPDDATTARDDFVKAFRQLYDTLASSDGSPTAASTFTTAVQVLQTAAVDKCKSLGGTARFQDKKRQHRTTADTLAESVFAAQSVHEQQQPAQAPVSDSYSWSRRTAEFGRKATDPYFVTSNATVKPQPWSEQLPIGGFRLCRAPQAEHARR